MDPQIKLKLPEETDNNVTTSSNNLNISIQPNGSRYNSLPPSSPMSPRKSGNTSDCII